MAHLEGVVSAASIAAAERGTVGCRNDHRYATDHGGVLRQLAAPRVPFPRLTVPLTLIFLGLGLISLPASGARNAARVSFGRQYLFGLFCTVVSLAIWTWYAVSKSGSSTWIPLVGVNTLLLSLGLLAALLVAARLALPTPPLAIPSGHGSLYAFVGASRALGFHAS